MLKVRTCSLIYVLNNTDLNKHPSKYSIYMIYEVNEIQQSFGIMLRKKQKRNKHEYNNLKLKHWDIFLPFIVWTPIYLHNTRV